MVFCLLCCATASAQRHRNWVKILNDSEKISNHKFVNNVCVQIKNSILCFDHDTAAIGIVLIGKSEAPYLPYQGKIIRHIKVESLDFERNFTDTSRRIATIAGHIADALHTNTREFVIRDNLFIRENTPLNAYKVADNERYLRSLNYINDARIHVVPLKNNPDSVDLLVVTKDLFTLLVDGSSDGINHIKTKVVNADLAGMGQSLELDGLYDYDRNPNWGYGASYTKNNVAHSFIDASVGYSTMNNNYYKGIEETTEYIKLSRPLFSPYSHFAGGFLISQNRSYNSYHQIDSTFAKYKYSLLDGWIGYNIGINKLTETNNSIRDRRFLAVRYYSFNFDEVPEAVGTKFDPFYNTRKAVLGQFTFFRQDYYKTQYIYGFGTTEDLPYGYNISFVGGWTKQLDLERPYFGLNAQKYIATNRGEFIQLFFRTGGYQYKKNIQDASFVIGANAYSRIMFWNSTKIRQYASLSYSQLFDRVTSEPLKINNGYGIRGFLSDSAYGNRRLSLAIESEFYLKYKILGFQFAPFPFADISMIGPDNTPFTKASFYSSIGGGVRTRNENLVFGTIEFRFYVFPIAPQRMAGFKIIITSNLRYRYNSNLITAPDVVQINQTP